MFLDDFDVDAEYLMPLDTPLLKVSRPVAACSRCRNAKIKCDGQVPVCSSCKKNGRAAECTAANDQFARGKERSYVATLETRIEKLINKLEDAKARKPSVISIPDDETAVPSRRESMADEGHRNSETSLTSQTSQDSQEPITKAQRRREASAIDDLVSDFGFLSVNATARDFYGFTSAMSYARLIISACSKEPLTRDRPKQLPPHYIAMGLIQHYLNNIFVLTPVFDEASLYLSVNKLYPNRGEFSKVEPFDHWLVHMILAIANASMSKERGDPSYQEGIDHVCAALEHAEGVLHPGSIPSVQALVLLTEYAMLDPHHFDSWELIGAASRAMVDLGLHQDPPKGTIMGKDKLALRRKVFHCVYALDRSISLVQARAFSFSDDSAKVKVPFQPAKHPSSRSGARDEPKAWLQSHEQAFNLINLRQLQSKWYTELFQSGRNRWEEPYPQIWIMCLSMHRWFESLTPTINMNMGSYFRLELLYSYVYILSPSSRVPAICLFAQKLIFEYCIQYSELMLRLIGDPSYTAPLTFYDAMRVYMTGRQFLDVLTLSMEDLLNGIMPTPPRVPIASVPPPAIPDVQIPTGDTVQHFNTIRSVRCIKQTAECLSLFGKRWGYMSWSQRYKTESSDMLESLEMKLQEYEKTSGARRPSMWHHTNSTGSVGSNHSSATYISHIPQTPVQVYSDRHVSDPQSIAHSNTSPGYSISPPPMAQPLYHPDRNVFPQSSPQYQQAYPSQQPSYDQQFSHNFGMSSFPPGQQHSNFQARPSQQFASWGGYDGQAHSHALEDDEENAVPPHSQSWVINDR